MRSPARILFVLFTLLLTVQGEPVLGARTKVIVRPAAGRSVPEEAYGICLPVRLSCDGVAVCGYDAQLPTGERVAALSADELAARGVPRLDDVVRQWRVGIFASFWNFARPRRSRFRRRSVPNGS